MTLNMTKSVMQTTTVTRKAIRATRDARKPPTMPAPRLRMKDTKQMPVATGCRIMTLLRLKVEFRAASLKVMPRAELVTSATGYPTVRPEQTSLFPAVLAATHSLFITTPHRKLGGGVRQGG